MNWILHIDGDGFFVSCELSRRPDLRGKPVVTGAERGIATALSYEAKALGIVRGTPIFKIRREFPQVVVLPSDFELYGMMAERMYSIVRRFSPTVEKYSIDECFAEIIMSTPSVDIMQGTVECVRDTLEDELGVSFSVGIATTKTLAKIASNWAKPHGAVVILPADREAFLAKTPIEKVWGIGPANSRRLRFAQAGTALDFARKDKTWIERCFAKPQNETWLELNGISILPVSTDTRVPQSIQRTGTFTPSSSNKDFLWTQLSKHTEEACRSARLRGLFATRVSFFLKTQDFHYENAQVELPSPTNSPQDILTHIVTPFIELFDSKIIYRATGVTFLAFSGYVPASLFGTQEKQKRQEMVCKSIDSLNVRFGTLTVFLASSLIREKRKTKDERKETAMSPLYQSKKSLFGETTRRHLRLPNLGLVT